MSHLADELARVPQPATKKTALAGWTVEVEAGLRLVALVGALGASGPAKHAAALLRRKRERLPARRAPPGHSGAGA